MTLADARESIEAARGQALYAVEACDALLELGDPGGADELIDDLVGASQQLARDIEHVRQRIHNPHGKHDVI